MLYALSQNNRLWLTKNMLEPLVIAMHRFWHGIGSVLRFGHAVPMEWIFWCTQVAGRELLGQHLSGSKFLSFEYFELSSCGASCGAQTFALWLEAHSWSWFAACEGDPKFGLNPHTFLLKSRKFQQLRPYLSGNSCPTWLQGLAIVFLWWLVAWWPKQRGAESVRLEATKLWKTWFATAVGTQYPFFLVAEAISDFSIANDANVFRLLLFAQRNLEDGEGEQNSVKIHPKTPCFHWHFRKSDSSPPQFRIESLQP